MDHSSLRTASTYLNNLLLARGLLRNSAEIDFVKPSKESRAQIINLVHDLILREDRDRDQREHVAVTIRHMRAEDTRKNVEIEKLKEKHEEAARSAVQAQAAERAAQTELKKVERAMKSLQDQTARLKTSLAQVKSQCANDMRKRDLELARLKTHLQGQQRGNKAAMTAPSMTITGGSRGRAFDASVHELRDPAYSLRQETTEFLTQLSQSLSDENDSLIGLVRGALSTMKQILGLPSTALRHPDSAIGSLSSNEDLKQAGNGDSMLHALPTSYDTLAADMDATLSQLKSILHNPNFVTIEEVEVREEEIARLREGWELMERRWKDVLLMMEGWRRRMDTGDTIDIEDLRRGMGLVSPQRPERNKEQISAGAEESFVNEEDVSEIKLPGIEEVDSSIILEPPRLSNGLANSSPKRRRDILEPPEFFDLRPTSAKSTALSSPVPEPDMSEHDNTDEASPPMTIEEKLSLAQAEAEEAAAVARAAATKVTTKAESQQKQSPAKRTARVSFGLDGAANEEGDDTLGKMASPMVKRTKIRGRPKKRKSTLSPEELEALVMSAEV